MKKLFFALIVLVSFITAFTKFEDRGLAKVERMQGKEIYIMSEPLQRYEVVERINDFSLSMKSCKIQNLVEIFVNKAHRKDIEFDAILIDGNSRAILVKWLE